MNNQTIAHDIKKYIGSGHTGIYLQTTEHERIDLILKNISQELDSEIIEWNFRYGVVNFENKKPLSELNEIHNLPLSDYIYSWYTLDEELGTKIILIKNINEIIAYDQLSEPGLSHLISHLKALDTQKSCVIMVGESGKIPPMLSNQVVLIDVPTPDRESIKEIIDTFTNDNKIQITDDLKSKLAVIGSGLKTEQIKQSLKLALNQFDKIDAQALTLMIEEKKQIISKTGTLEMIDVKDNIEDIGGLENLKEWLKSKSKIIHNLEDSEKNGVKPPKGVLIAGMPGCGKSLTAKATATLFKLPLLRLDIGSLLGKYVGDSEANMKKALKMADSISPCVLWIDELEKAFAGASGNNNSEVATRLLGFFLTWMQEKTGAVFVIATANDVTKVPPELLRKGRFDEIFYVGFPNKDERKKIFEIHLKKSTKDINNIEIDQLVKKSKVFTGSDIESAINLSLEKSFVQEIPLDTSLILKVLKETVPLRETLKDSIKEYEKIFEKQKLTSASKQVGLTTTEITRLKTGNKLDRIKVAKDQNTPDDVLTELLNDKKIDVVLTAIANENMTPRMLSDVIEDTQAETDKYSIQKFNIAIKHIQTPLNLLKDLLESTNEILSDENKKSLSKVVSDDYLYTGNNYYYGFGGVTKDNIKAMEWYKKSADLNNSDAMIEIGGLYSYGHGVAQDDQQAMKWYRKSADLDNSDAMIQIGDMYEYGNGVDESAYKAEEWYKKSAQLKNSEAMLKLGDLNYNRGGGHSYSEAMKWYKKSANLNNNSSKEKIGDMYCKGEGVTQDHVKAMEWYKSADLSESQAMIKIGDMYYNENEKTHDYINAMKWYIKSADLDNSKAMEKIGDMYYNEKGVTQDYVKAMEWYNKSSDLNNKYTMEKIGDMYYNGKGVTQDYIKAIEWYERSKSYENIGDMYYNGKGVAQDYTKAMEWYEKSNSQEKIADMYYNGYGVTQDYTKAMEIYTELCDDVFAIFMPKHIRICNKLGDMYFHGYGTTQDYVKAMEMYKKSCESISIFSLGTDHSETYKKIGNMYYNGHGVDIDTAKAKEWTEKKGGFASLFN